MVTKVRAPRFAGQAFGNQSTEAGQVPASFRQVGAVTGARGGRQPYIAPEDRMVSVGDLQFTQGEYDEGFRNWKETSGEFERDPLQGSFRLAVVTKEDAERADRNKARYEQFLTSGGPTAGSQNLQAPTIDPRTIDLTMYPNAKNQGLGKQQPGNNLNLGNNNQTNDSVTQRQSSGNEMPTMVQFYEPAKGARGGRLGASPAFAATTTQFGYSQPGANITVSPTFSNIGSPNVNVAGRDMSQGGPGPDVFGGPGADVLNTTVQNPPTGAPQTPTGAPQTPTGMPKPQTPTSTNRPRTPRPQTPTEQPQSGGGAKIKAKNLAARKALSKAQEKGAGDKITKAEIDRLIKNKGYRAVSSQVKKGSFTIGAGAQKVLDRKAQRRNR